MALAADIVRLTRRSEALKSLQLGPAPQLDANAFARFPEMLSAVADFNEQQKLSYDRLKNLLADALLAARSIPP